MKKLILTVITGFACGSCALFANIQLVGESEHAVAPITITKEVANVSSTLADLIENTEGDSKPIQIPRITHYLLKQAVTPLMQTVAKNSKAPDKQLSDEGRKILIKKLQSIFDQEGPRLLVELLNAFNFLASESLLDLTAQTIVRNLDKINLKVPLFKDLPAELIALIVSKVPLQSLNETTQKNIKNLLLLHPDSLTLKGHVNRVNYVQFSPDGTRIMTTSDDETARVWDAATGNLLHTLDRWTNCIIFAQFSPDGTKIITTSWDNTAKVWDTATGDLLLTLKGHTNWTNYAQFSPDGAKIITTSDDNTAKVWDAATGDLLLPLKGHTSQINSAQFSLDGTKIITASADTTAKVWNAVTGDLLLTLKGHTNWVNYAQFSPDGTKIVTASADTTAKIWDAVTGDLLLTLKGHTDWVNYAQFSPDGTEIVTASGDTTTKIWDAATGYLFLTLKGHTDWVNYAQFSPNGRTIVTASTDKTARVWQLKSKQHYYLDIWPNIVMDYYNKQVVKKDKGKASLPD